MTDLHLQTRRTDSRGVTLIELLVTIVVISIALVALTSVISSAVSHSADPLITHRAVMIAQAYSDEILGKRFSETTPVGGVPPATDASVCVVGAEAGESRATFDDLDDYNGLVDNPPALQTDAGFSRYDDYTVSVSVTCTGTALGFANNHDAKSVSITISSPDGRTSVYSLYRGNF